MKSTIDVEINCLSEITMMLRQFDIKIIGSKEAHGLVCLSIEGPLVPEFPKIKIGAQLIIRGSIATLTASCVKD